MVQTIAGIKWLLSTHRGYIQTIRTTLDIRDVARFDDVMILEIKEGTSMKYVLAKQDGMQLVLGPGLDSMRNFTVSGTNIFIPDDRKILVHSTVGLQKVAEIPCTVVNEQSVFGNCVSGILCLTGNSLYLLNKS